MLGHSFGEHAAAFAAGCLNRHEFILTAHARGKVVSLCEPGAMAVVACSWEEAKDIAVKYEVEVRFYFDLMVGLLRNFRCLNLLSLIAIDVAILLFTTY